MPVTAQALARTYSDRVYADPWEKVLDYRRVQQYAADHPNAGRVAIGRALDLPPGRVRGWINAGMPDPVRGIQTAHDYEWLEAESTSKMAKALVELLAHVLAGGSINRNYTVTLAAGRRVDTAELRDVLTAVGVDSAVQHVDADNRATEVQAAENGSVLGRCLVAMGAIAGSKTKLEAFPAILDNMPVDVRASFARIYARHRAVTFETKDSSSINEDRATAYKEGLADLLTDVTGENATAGERGVILSAAAARALGVGRNAIER